MAEQPKATGGDATKVVLVKFAQLLEMLSIRQSVQNGHFLQKKPYLTGPSMARRWPP